MNGYIYFSDPPDHYTYPLSFPVRDWPTINDPSFIGIFFSKCRIGSQRPEDPDQRRPGVYFRMDRDLQVRFRHYFYNNRIKDILELEKIGYSDVKSFTVMANVGTNQIYELGVVRVLFSDKN